MPLAPARQLEGEPNLTLQLCIADLLGRGVRILTVVIALGVIVQVLEIVGQGVQLVGRAGIADLADHDAKRIVVGEQVAPRILP